MSSDPWKSRDLGLDCTRGLGMLLVLYGHILQIFFHKRPDGVFSHTAFDQWQAIYAFHMPLFFMVSGAIVAQFDGKTPTAVIRKSLYFLILAHIVDFAGFIVRLFVDRSAGPLWSQFADYLKNNLLLEENFATITPWFLVAYSLVRIISFFLLASGAAARRLVVVLLIASFAASYVFPQIFHLRALAPGVAFFLLGRWAALRGLRLNLWQAFAALGLALWLAHFNSGCTFLWEASCENTELPGYFAVLMIFGFYGSFPLFVVTAALGGFAALAIGEALSRTPLAPALCFPGRNTIDLLLINGFVLAFANPLLRRWIPVDDSVAFYIATALFVTLAHVFLLIVFAPILRYAKELARRIAGIDEMSLRQ